MWARCFLGDMMRFYVCLNALPKQYLLVLLGFLFFLSSCMVGWDGYVWHDQQRIAQLVFLCLIALTCFFTPLPRFSLWSDFCLVFIFSIGLVSCFLADYPGWAFYEWVRYLGLMLVVLFFASVGRDVVFLRAFFAFMVFAGLFCLLSFFSSYLFAFLSGVNNVDPMILFSGFSHPRFLGQFQVMLLPVLAALILSFRSRRWWLIGLLVLLSGHWCIVIALGGRGVVLMLAVSHLLLLLVCWRWWSMVFVQMLGALIGVALYSLFFVLVPHVAQLDVWGITILRTGLSARDVLWADAWSLFLQNPWLGAGPMHFSSLPDVIAAHPHNVIMQWLAEWGLPATLCMISLIFLGMCGLFLRVRARESSVLDVGLAVSVVAALLLAQLSGVFVMPYAETWLAVLVGFALAKSNVGREGWGRWRWLPSLLVTVSVLWILFHDVPGLMAREIRYMDDHSGIWVPRFWLQGKIPM